MSNERIGILYGAICALLGAVVAWIVPGFPWWSLVVVVGCLLGVVIPVRTHRPHRRH